MAPFPGPPGSIREAVSPSSDSVFSQNSISSNESGEEHLSPKTESEYFMSQEGSQHSVEVEINDNHVKKNSKVCENDVHNSGLVCTSPKDLAKIEAFHTSISQLASHFTTILFSDHGEEVLSSSQ